MTTILAGMRVVEASAFIAAPLGGMTLAQLGAEVIRIDPIRGGLDHRRWPIADDGTSLFWCGLNKGKKSVALDVASPEGRELAEAIICMPGENAGMLITNFPPRGWLAYDGLAAKRPDLIQLTLKGDRHGRSAVDYTVNPGTGLPFLTGGEGDAEPVNHILPAWDCITGQMVAVGLLAAERHRRLEGRGQHVTLALEDVALAVMGHLGFIAEAQMGRERERTGNYLFGAFGRDFLCQDKERVMVVGLTLKQWRSLCAATEIDAAIAELGQATGLNLALEGDRYRARHRIAELVGAWIAEHPLAVVAERFDACGVCWGRYRTATQMVREHPSCSPDNPMFSSVEQPGVGTWLSPGIPLDFSDLSRVEAAPAPRLGAHSEEILVGRLGLSEGAYGSLRDRGIVAGA